MAINSFLTKRALIDKANTMVIIFISVATFITIFCLVASKSLISQAKYQNRVINAKNKAYAQIQADVNAVNSLNSSYQAFVGTTQNVIGGNPSGNGSNDGDNAKIILDALPPQYDFPALATSLQKLLSSQNFTTQSITGVDQELTQQTNTSSPNPTPIAMLFQVNVSGDYNTVQKLVTTFQNSVRPFQFTSIQLSGSQNNLTMAITAQTYFQPQKIFTIKTETVR